MRHLEYSQIHRNRKESGGCQGLERGWNGELLAVIEFQFCRLKMFWRLTHLTLLNCRLKTG